MDLMDKLGKKEQATGTSPEAPKGEAIVGANSTSDNLRRGDNLISSSNGTGTPVETAPSVETPAAPAATVKDPDSWSKESALQEVTKLREENKAVRTKFQEQLVKVEEEKQVEIAKIKEQAAKAAVAEKELEALKAAAEDKKRSIEEKLADREAKLTRTDLEYKKQLEDKEKELQSIRAKASAYEAEEAARQQIYKERIKEELAKIPDEFKEYAEKMVKGVDNAQEAWLTISEASRKGLFGEKKVVVNHQVPGAADGARMNKQKLEEEAKLEKGKKTSRDKIKAGLSAIKSGQENTAFRSR